MGSRHFTTETSPAVTWSTTCTARVKDRDSLVPRSAMMGATAWNLRRPRSPTVHWGLTDPSSASRRDSEMSRTTTAIQDALGRAAAAHDVPEADVQVSSWKPCGS